MRATAVTAKARQLLACGCGFVRKTKNDGHGNGRCNRLTRALGGDEPPITHGLQRRVVQKSVTAGFSDRCIGNKAIAPDRHPDNDPPLDADPAGGVGVRWRAIAKGDPGVLRRYRLYRVGRHRTYRAMRGSRGKVALALNRRRRCRRSIHRMGHRIASCRQRLGRQGGNGAFLRQW